jgi:hypothetical protein
MHSDKSIYPTWGEFENMRKAEAKTCLYESVDGGSTFQRKTARQHKYIGSFENNIVFNDGEAHGNNAGDNFTPFLDTNPMVPKSERFKAIGGSDSSLPNDKEKTVTPCSFPTAASHPCPS